MDNFVAENLEGSLLIIGVVSTTFGLSGCVIEFVMYINSFSSPQKPSTGAQFFICIAMVFYFVTGFDGMCFYCLDTGKDLERHFNGHQGLLIICLICAFVDIFLKSSSSSAASGFFALYFCIGLVSLFLAYAAQKECKRVYEARLKQFNGTGQGENPLIAMSGQDGLPKFAVPITVVKVESETGRGCGQESE